MFDNIAKQLEIQSLGVGRTNFKITKEEFETFYKEFLFEEIKGEVRMGTAFCEKYNEPNSVLSILSNKSAKEHIRKFYVK
jgi:hypothetical protein